MKEISIKLTPTDCKWNENPGNCYDCPYFVDLQGDIVVCEFVDDERETEAHEDE